MAKTLFTDQIRRIIKNNLTVDPYHRKVYGIEFASRDLTEDRKLREKILEELEKIDFNHFNSFGQFYNIDEIIENIYFLLLNN